MRKSMALAAAALCLLAFSPAFGHDDDDDHKNQSGNGHYWHKGWGWGHHGKGDGGKKKCYKKKKICFCKKHKKKCYWKKYRVPCPKPKKDAGPKCDHGVSPDSHVSHSPDVGYQEPDAGYQDPDAGRPDMRQPKPDAGQPAPDAGTQSPDAGVPTADGSLHSPYDGGTTDAPCRCHSDAGGGTDDDHLELVGGGCSMSNTNSSSGAAAVLGLLLLVFLVRSRRKLITLLGCGILALSLGASTAHADGLRLSVPGLRPAASQNSYYMTEAGRLLNHGSFSSQVFLNYARRPLALQRASDGKLVSMIIKSRVEMDLLLSFGLFDRFELGLGLPLMLGQQDGNLGTLGRTTTLEAGAGDFRLIPKLLIAQNKHVALSLIAGLSFPSARRSQLLGESSGVTFAPRLAVSLYHHRFDASINLGWRTRTDQSFSYGPQDVTIDDELIGGLAIRVPLWRGKLDAVADLAFSVSAFDQDDEEKSAEFLGGLRAYLPYEFTANLAAGAGLSRGIGTPSYRLLAGFGWQYDRPKKAYPACRPKTIVKKIPVPVYKIVPFPVVRTVKVVRSTIVLPPVYFATDKDTVLPQSMPTLDTVAKLLKKHKWIRKVLVEGHTDHRASDSYNLDLSKRRAKSVYRYLVKRGIDPDRLKQIGYGEARRVDTTNTKPGMAKNRRVEFVVIDPRQ